MHVVIEREADQNAATSKVIGYLVSTETIQTHQIIRTAFSLNVSVFV